MLSEKEIFLKKLGNHLKTKRQEKGYSTIEMSRRLFMDSGNYTRIENGKTNPTSFTLFKFCEALEIRIADLFRDFDS
ncbi:MAG: helix-turn-helix domain-containing protein [Cyclobacteriaceae bacterium]|nr:helix-turn-helix domain-containing protein [Cyclobacteriaceae bacterium]